MTGLKQLPCSTTICDCIANPAVSHQVAPPVDRSLLVLTGNETDSLCPVVSTVQRKCMYEAAAVLLSSRYHLGLLAATRCAPIDPAAEAPPSPHTPHPTPPHLGRVPPPRHWRMARPTNLAPGSPGRIRDANISKRRGRGIGSQQPVGDGSAGGATGVGGGAHGREVHVAHCLLQHACNDQQQQYAAKTTILESHFALPA